MLNHIQPFFVYRYGNHCPILVKPDANTRAASADAEIRLGGLGNRVSPKVMVLLFCLIDTVKIDSYFQGRVWY